MESLGLAMHSHFIICYFYIYTDLSYLSLLDQELRLKVCRLIRPLLFRQIISVRRGGWGRTGRIREHRFDPKINHGCLNKLEIDPLNQVVALGAVGDLINVALAEALARYLVPYRTPFGSLSCNSFCGNEDEG